MNPLIETFKRDVESFDEQFGVLKFKQLGEIKDNVVFASQEDAEKVKKHFIATTLNLITKMIEELEGRKKENLDRNREDYKNHMWNLREDGYRAALSDTISQLEELKNYLEESKK